jgi:hypothetical protein
MSEVLASLASVTTRTGTIPDGTPVKGVFLDVTATPNNAETIGIVIEAQDPESEKWCTVYASALVAATVFGAAPTDRCTLFLFESGVAATAFTGLAGGVVTAQANLPPTAEKRVRLVQSGSGSWTTSVGYV